MRNRSGATLVEVLVALAMLFTGALGLLGTGILIQRYLAQGQWQSAVAAAAREEAETLRATAERSGCLGLSGGSSAIASGGSAAWTVTGDSTVADVSMVISRAGVRPESLALRVGCP